MTATRSVSSNASNFMSAMKNGVDPRTGLYTLSVNLPELQTNDLRGPGFGLSLDYNPLNTLDTGYGWGWDLLLSQYDPGKQILSLSTGETFKVTGVDSKTGQYVMKEKKLDSFHFYPPDKDGHYRVVHKSGLIEVLKEFGSSQKPIALPLHIYSPTGHKVTLDYVPFSGTHQILSWIKDDSDQTLLTVKRESSSVVVLLHPFADGGPLARFVMTLEATDKRVQKITLPTENEASWRFGYDFKNNHLCITSVDTPTGGREEILYQDLGHQFPASAGRPPLPRVTEHTIHPGAGQPAVNVRYTYPDEKNFLGFGLSTTWDDDGLDNLYKHGGDYLYRCVEALWVADKPSEKVPAPAPKEVRTIERTFNRFHLLTSETTTQNKHVQSVETTYFITPGKLFEEQPNYCQLPKDVQTSWTIPGTGRYRSETVSNTYDTYGNLLEQTKANGVIETSTWYPADDADDFVGRIKDRTVTPAPSPNGKAPTLRTYYTYQQLPALTGSPVSKWYTPESERLVERVASGETELERTVYTNFNQPDDAFLHGRVKRQTLTLNNKSSLIDYKYQRFVSPQLGVPVQQTTQTFSTDFDSVGREIIRQHSLLTSQEVLSQVDDVETRYTHDELGRPTSEIVGYGTAYEARRDYEYTLCAARGEQAEQLVINAKKVKTRSALDGLARVFFVERDHVDSDNPSRFRQTSASDYDEWNNLVKQTEYDWMDGKQKTLTTCFKYDDWAQQCTVIGPDGIESHQTIDPIGTPDSKGPIARSWRQSAEPDAAIVGLSETWLNLFEKPARTSVLDATGKEIARETYHYDGLGRCTEQRDPYDLSTLFTYDARSRLISNTLPDGSIVQRDYAAHSASELPVVLRVSGDGVNFKKAGEQEFDGLERLTRLTTGQRTERYTYEGGKLQISSKTTPANESITYNYNLTLTDQPTASHAPDETADFTYDSTSAHLIQAKNELGTRDYNYNPANQLLDERWVDQSGKSWQTLYSSSMQGRLLKRTDVKLEDIDGLDTVHDYDECGRLKSVEQGLLQALFEYNNLGQLFKTTTTDGDAKSVLVTELKYDDHGREILRTLTLDQQPVRTQEQSWRRDGLLKTRHLKQGAASLLQETFDYDSRGRLTSHECSGSTLPRDSEGRAIKKQVFNYDALDNIKIKATTFADSSLERAGFVYADDDPCLLKEVRYLPPSTKPALKFCYDLNGNQLNDERGQNLSYDSQSRLLRVENAGGQVVGQYGYDSHNHLVTSQQGNQSKNLRFYQGEQLTTVVQDELKTQILYHGGQPLGQQQAGDGKQTLLLLTDANHSVLGESQQRDLRTAVYSAYGERHSEDTLQSLLAFNGEVRDAASAWYLLGRGYRAYNPVLMRFHSPDSFSPFGSGGVNPFCYCLGNPIALRDPTGHQASGWSGRLRRPDEDYTPQLGGGGGGDWTSWLFVALGAVSTVALGIATYATAGALAPLFGKALAFTVGKAVALGTATALTAGATGASTVNAIEYDPVAAEWALYLGIASIVPSVGAGVFSGMAKAASTVIGPLTGPKAIASLDAMMSKLRTTLPQRVYTPRFHVPPPVAATAAAAVTAVPGITNPAAAASTSTSSLMALSAAPVAAGSATINPATLAKGAAGLTTPKPTAPLTSVAADQLSIALGLRNQGQPIAVSTRVANNLADSSGLIDNLKPATNGPRRP